MKSKKLLKKMAKIFLYISAINGFILVGSALSDQSFNTHYTQYSYWFVIPTASFFTFGMLIIFIANFSGKWGLKR